MGPCDKISQMLDLGESISRAAKRICVGPCAMLNGKGPPAGPRSANQGTISSSGS